MPFNGAGAFVRLYSWVAEQATGNSISATKFDNDGNDVAAALSDCITRDGQSPPTADLPMAGHAFTGLRAGAAAGESVTFDQMNSAITAGQAGSNRLHNSAFSVNQRALSGAVTLGAGAYGHDRWKGGSGGCTYSFTTNGADTTITITAGSLVQIIGALDIEGGIYTLSQDSTGTAQARIYQGTPSGALAALPITTGSLTAGTATTVEFGTGTILRPQFSPGATAKPYSRRPYGLELKLCETYYEVGQYYGYGQNSGSQVQGAQVLFRTVKASVPTITVLSYSSFAFNAPSVQNLTGITTIYGSGLIATSNGSSGGLTLWGTFAASCEP